MDPSPSSIELIAEPSRDRDRSWLVGAIVALAVGGAFLGVLVGFSPYGFDSTTLFDQPVYLVILMAMSAALGSRLSWRASSGGWLRAASAGVIFGLLWSPIAILVLFFAALVDASGRGIFSASTIPQDAVYLMYGMAIFSLYGAIVFVPLGLVWALTTRGIHWLVGRLRRGRISSGPAPTAGLILALLLTAAGGGAAQTLSYAPWSSRCLAIPGGTPTDAAFSPAGDLLVVAVRPDAGAVGTVLLMKWPSGRPVEQWAAIADEAVTVGPDGHVYWSSSDFNNEGSGIVSAVPGAAPTLLVGPDSPGLSDLTWTSAGLIGITTDTRSIARISFASSPATLKVQPGPGEIGMLWASTDGTDVATQGWVDSTVEITGPSGSASVPVKGGALSFALSGDRQTLVVAPSQGGIRVVDIATGLSRQITPGTPAFIALSDHGDLAWTNYEQFGQARLCTSTLGQLGAS